MSSEQLCVYFCGAEGTGKTTLAGYVALHYGLPLLLETARMELDARGLTFAALRGNAALTGAYQRGVFERQLAQEAAATPPYVSDGTILENLAYASENARNVADLNARVHTDVASSLVDRLQSSIVFFTRPHESMMAQDGLRAGINYAAKQRIDAKIELFMQLWRVKFVSIDTPNAAAREELVDYVLAVKGFTKCQK